MACYFIFGGKKDEHVHDFSHQTVENATCVDNSIERYFCTVCGYEYRKENPNTATGIHTYGIYIYNNDAACGKSGTETAKCKYCESTDTQESTAHPATGLHAYGSYTYNNDATCVTNGTESATCLNCSHVDTRTKANTATGIHIYGSYTYNNDATCIVAFPIAVI